ncbi:MAG: hypothetical protein RIS76_2710 [Verrucomicrobiota bacterium]|jgi:ATP-binding cassette subfamily B protein/subfamily B ATP-binding cassette protein MsbA
MGTYTRAAKFFRADSRRIAAALGLLLLNTGLALLKPWPLALMVDRLGGSPDRMALSWAGSTATFVGMMAGALVLIHGTHALLGAWQQAVVISTGLRGLARVRQAVFDWLVRLSFRRLQGSQAGDLIYRATWDTYAFQTLFTQGLFTSLGASLSVVAMTVVMARLNVSLTLVALATVPMLLLVMRAFGPRLGRRAGAAQAADASIASAVQQTVANLPLIQSFTREEEESARFATQVDAAFTNRWGQHRIEVFYLALVAVVLALGMAAIVWVGGIQVSVGRLTVGELIVFVAYLVQLYEPLNQLSHVGSTVSQARAGAGRVLELLDARDAEPVSPRVPASLPQPPLGVEFRGVRFAYTAGQPVLNDLSFAVAPGESVALIGASGAGKSTLLQLIPRFFDPESGTILIGGLEAREYPLRELRQRIAFVLQESLLVPGTIADNIRIGRVDAPREAVEAAARAANADGFIRSLPKGYETRIGDGAARLSVGEKQRLNLARAFLKDAPILLLDEPTSALDAASEEAVLSGLRTLMRNRTVLMVAHRKNTLRAVDRILVLEGGRVVSSGTPAEMLSREAASPE